MEKKRFVIGVGYPVKTDVGPIRLSGDQLGGIKVSMNIPEEVFLKDSPPYRLVLEEV